jgi:DNA-binding transcriptional ArsR family regulator
MKQRFIQLWRIVTYNAISKFIYQLCGTLGVIPNPVRFQLPEKRGHITGLWDSKKKLSVVRAEGAPITLNENQGQILRQLSRSEDGLIATELAERLGMTHAGVIFLMKPLVESGLVERTVLRGGGVLYYMTTVLREEPSAEVKQAITRIEEKFGKKIDTLGIKQLAQYTKELPADLRRTMLDWLLLGEIDR